MNIYLKYTIALLVWLLAIPTSHAQPQNKFEFTPLCAQAYTQLYQLNYTQANQTLTQEINNNPTNAAIVLLQNYADFYDLFLNEDPQLYKTKKILKDLRLQTIQNCPTSAYTQWAIALIHFQWAAIEIKQNNKFNAAIEFRKSFLQLKTLSKNYPQFPYTNMLLGTMQAVIGTIPKEYQWASNLFGLSGTQTQGVQKLQNFLAANPQNNDPFVAEGIFYYAFIKAYLLNNPDGAFAFLTQRKLDVSTSLMNNYLLANLYLNHQNGKQAIVILNQKPTAASYLKFPFMDYLKGIALLQQNNKAAGVHITQFITQTKGTFYVKEAYQRLWQYYLLQGNKELALKYKKLLTQKGSSITDADKTAQREALKNNLPQTQLLQARMYSDGGYYPEALAVLANLPQAQLPLFTDTVEYYYRYGKIYDDANKPTLAKPYYTRTISLGQALPEYFAAKAAFKLGAIYEAQQNKDSALYYYNLCIKMPNQEFKSSIEQRAKGCINRIKQQ